MILDTSALAAILFGEPEAALYTQLIHDADRCLMSAANSVELSIVIEGQIGPDAGRQCDAFFRRAHIIIEPRTVEQAHLARQAFLDFGKGCHSAALILATASPMRSPRSSASLSSSRGRISKRPTSYLLSDRSRMTNSSTERTLFSDAELYSANCRSFSKRLRDYLGRSGLLA